MAYDNTMKIEFYKPKYNLDIKFDGDDSFDLLFKNVSGELFFSASVEDYNSYVSFEDEECKFTNGELVAKVDISDLMETIANGQLRNTNGTTYGEWIPRIVGDYKTEHDLVFDGKTYADRGYWELFFKEMSKDEIKDFIEFCRDYIDIPNLEFSFREFDFNNDSIVVNGKGYSITINDDLTIEMAEEFTCKSSDVVDVWESNHDYGDEFEEKKSAKNSLKEGIDVKIVYADDTPSEYIDDVTRSDILDIIEESPEVYKIFDVSGSKKKLVWSDEYGFERAYESKKSVGKSLKEEAITTKLFRFIQDLYDVHYITEEQLNKFQKHDFSKKEIKVLEQNYEIYKTSNEFDEINNAIKSTVNMINSFKESLKESTDEDFSLYDLNKHDPFVKEWIKNINKELKDVSIESIGDDEIIFRVWFDENIDLDIFDDIATDCMPRTLIEFMSDMNIDFGYQFVYEDDKFTENDYVFIRFVAW